MAFKWEFEVSPVNIPNWVWGLAYYSELISDLQLERNPHIPRDFEWRRLQKARAEGCWGSMGTNAAVRAVLYSPTRVTSDPTEEGMPK